MNICTTEISIEEVLSAADALLAGKGTMTPAEEKLDRERISFNILAVGDGPRKASAVRLLNDNGWRVWELSAGELARITVHDLLDLFIRYEINIVHSFVRHSWKLRLATLLTSLKMVFPTMLVKDKGKNFADLPELVAYYEDKFNRRLM
jgi:hypothetical protein